MKSGSYFVVGLRVFLWTVALATAIGGSFFGIAGALSLLRGVPYWGSENLFLTFICAGIAWLITAVFLLGKDTIHLPLNQPGTFLGNVRRLLEDMGYEVTSQSADALATRHAFQFVFLCRGIKIQCLDRQARISGSKIWVDHLRRRLRLQNFLGGSEWSSPEIALRDAGLLLKRVQIQMRVTPENLEHVNRHVLQLLAQEAQVVCEISLLAQSDTGIRESTVENVVRPWLREQRITAEIHKDLVKMAERSSGIILLSDLRRKIAAS